MPVSPTIHVTGDTYNALFFVPPGLLFLDGVNSEEAQAHAMPVGVEYIFRAIRAACHPEALVASAKVSSPGGVVLSRAPGHDPFVPHSERVAFYEIANVGTINDHRNSKKLPLLRFANADSQSMNVSALRAIYLTAGKDKPPPKIDVLVHWFGEMAGKQRPRWKPQKSHSTKVDCQFHLQVGLAAPLRTTYAKDEAPPVRPHEIAKPELARLLVVNIGEISAAQRIRRSLSYEAMAVDLLRLLRGDGSKAAPTEELKHLSMAGGDAADLSILAVRLSNAAVFVYACRKLDSVTAAPKAHDSKVARAVPAGGAPPTPSEDFVEIGAWLLCHKSECAPLSQPELGQMVGYTGFVSAQLAAAMADWITRNKGKITDHEKFCEAVHLSVRRSLVWQRTAYVRGCLHMLFEQQGSKWKPTSANAAATSEKLGYDHLFAEIITAVRTEFEENAGKLSTAKSLRMRITHFDECFLKEVRFVKVDIERAVAHRTQWFMARSVAEKWDFRIAKKDQQGNGTQETDTEATFRKIATEWLCTKSNGKAKVPGKDPPIPIVRIGEAELTDRREIEDFLAIYHALRVYANSRRENIPLNIAVFGAPGAGKSFAVKQVVKHLGETYEGVFRKEPLTFNLAQFKSLDDLPDALHLVRNECLSSEIPIVFFDEFDSSFNGLPFAWLKFFLAPMQDGDFYHAGQTYKMGRAVFVFAGGVNRSFEELNGRVRNPSFCEAKGPDFISRLKAHLNVQGINMPEEDSDQGRYILRRGILLRGIVRRRLGIKQEQEEASLLHPRVTNALLRVERFKHGVRSLEAIIKMCAARPGHPIGPSDLPSMDQLEMHVDASKLLKLVDNAPECI